LKIVPLHAAGGSLADVLLNPPMWWTPTAKAKAVAVIGLANWFAHGRGQLHGAVKARNVLFDADRRTQIADKKFSSNAPNQGKLPPIHWFPRTGLGDLKKKVRVSADLNVTNSLRNPLSLSVEQLLA
jgi:hypothetical protein